MPCVWNSQRMRPRDRCKLKRTSSWSKKQMATWHHWQVKNVSWHLFFSKPHQCNFWSQFLKPLLNQLGIISWLGAASVARLPHFGSQPHSGISEGHRSSHFQPKWWIARSPQDWPMLALHHRRLEVGCDLQWSGRSNPKPPKLDPDGLEFFQFDWEATNRIGTGHHPCYIFWEWHGFAASHGQSQARWSQVQGFFAKCCLVCPKVCRWASLSIGPFFGEVWQAVW